MPAPDALARTVETLAQATRLAGMNDPRDLEVLRLRRRCAALECEVDALKRREAGPEFPPSFLGLTRSQLRVLAIEDAQRQHAATLSLPGGLAVLSPGMRERHCAEHERRVSALRWAHEMARGFSALADAERLALDATRSGFSR